MILGVSVDIHLLATSGCMCINVYQVTVLVQMFQWEHIAVYWLPAADAPRSYIKC